IIINTTAEGIAMAHAFWGRQIGLAAATVLALASCSTAGTETGSDTLPAELELLAVQDLSGTSGPNGQATMRGMEVAIEQINESGLLENTKLSLKVEDSATDPTKAANAMNQVATSDTPLAFGSFTSTSALAQAPIAERAGLPTIFTQAEIGRAHV